MYILLSFFFFSEMNTSITNYMDYKSYRLTPVCLHKHFREFILTNFNNIQ